MTPDRFRYRRSTVITKGYSASRDTGKSPSVRRQFRVERGLIVCDAIGSNHCRRALSHNPRRYAVGGAIVEIADWLEGFVHFLRQCTRNEIGAAAGAEMAPRCESI
jgi:hypothetical protein